MIIVLKPGSSEADIEDVSRRVRDFGFKTHLSRGEVRTIIGVVGDDRAKEQLLALQSLDSVESVAVATLTERLGRLSDDRMRQICSAPEVAVDCR